METVLQVAVILVSIVLVGVLLLQTKGTGLGAVLGGSDSGIFRTRRGLEKILFRFTIVWASLFVVLALISARLIAGPPG